MNFTVGEYIYKPVVTYKDGVFHAKTRDYQIVSKSITETLDGSIHISYEVENRTIDDPLKFKVEQDIIEKHFFNSSLGAKSAAIKISKMFKCTV